MCGVLLLFFGHAQPASATDPTLLDQALDFTALTRDDVAIRADLLEGPGRSDLFYTWMREPLSAPARGQDLASGLLSLTETPSQWFAALSKLLGRPPAKATAPGPAPEWVLPEGLPEPVETAVGKILDGIWNARRHLDAAFQGMDPAGAPAIEKYLHPPGMNPGEEDGLSEGLDVYGRIREAVRASQEMDWDELQRAGLCVLETAWAAAVELGSGALKDFPSPLVFETPLGTVRVGGSGPDVHEGPAVLILDTGGDDLYRGQVAAGEAGSCSVVLDLAGDDIYVGGDRTQGAGVRGVGLLMDLKGNDTYRAKNGAQGAGLFGVGLLVDLEGDDQYWGGRFVQAAASWGTGGLLDAAGNDTYRCASGGQAYAWLPGAAMLCDRCGDDRYIAGFDEPDPRDPGMQQSFAQGFAMGYRDLCAGGTALLADGEGNDLYHGQYFSQGSSYWLSVGILYDESGRDTYISRRYSQGAGIHISLGLLVDGAGDDHSIAWGVSQGCGHDWGVGVLVNRDGNDSYAGDWLTLGASEANGIGIFADLSGDDGYESRSGPGTGRLVTSRRSGGLGLFMDAGGRDRYSGKGANDHTWAANRWEVGTDGEFPGRDGFPASRARSGGACGLEGASQAAREREKLAGLLEEAPELPARERVEKLLEIAAHWGLDKETPKEAMARLMELPPEISIPVLADAMGAPDIMIHIRIQEVFQRHAREALPVLVEKARHEDPDIRAKALVYLSGLRDTRALGVCLENACGGPGSRVRAVAARALGEMLAKSRLERLVPLREALESARKNGDAGPLLDYLHKPTAREDSVSVAARAVSTGSGEYTENEDIAAMLFEHSGEILKTLERWTGDIAHPREAVEVLSPLAHHSDPRIRANAVYALGQMEDTGSLQKILEALEDSDSSVRDAAALALVFFGEEAVDPLSEFIEDRGSAVRILALDSLGRIDTPRALQVIAEYLEDGELCVKEAAERALGIP